ncbi:MAG: glycoside hydrolase domain-containing protein [Chthoniobacterales bacterium]
MSVTRKISILLAASFFFLGKSTAAVAQSAPSVAVVSSMEKLRPDQKPTDGKESIQLYAARGEVEDAQIIITAGDKDLKNVSLKASTLRTANGGKIEPELKFVGYVNIHTPDPNGFGQPGDYPDILYPIKNFPLAAEKSQSIWFTVKPPLGTKPGDYTGSVQVVADRKTIATLKVSLRVFDFDLPRMSALKTSFGYGPWNHAKPNYYGSNWPDSKQEEAFLKQMIDYRMSPNNTGIGGILKSLKNVFTQNSDGQWEANWSDFDEEVQKRLDQGWNFFYLAHLPLSWWHKDAEKNLTIETNRWKKIPREEQAQILRQLNDHLVEKGWADRFAYKCFDEPSINEHNEAFLRELSEFFQKNAPDLRILMVTTDCREIKLAGEKPIFTWVPHLPSLHLCKGYEDFLKERQKVGEEGWTYICETRANIDVSHAYPDIAPIDREGASQRAYGWLAWRNRLDGILYWNVTEWDYRGGYDNPKNSNKGEGVLFYPDLENHGQPFPSIRAALVRDGFEDYDLLFYLNETINRLDAIPNLQAADKETIKKAQALLDVSDIMPNLRDFNRDPQAYADHHRAVLEALENLTQLETKLNPTAKKS